MPRTVRFTCAGRTDVGVVRSGNEDAFLMVPNDGVFIVADGMGGHAAGEVASALAVRIIHEEIKAHRELIEGYTSGGACGVRHDCQSDRAQRRAEGHAIPHSRADRQCRTR